MINMTKKEYAKYVKDKAPASHLIRDMALAWIVGGGICVLGQACMALFQTWGLAKENATTATAMALITLAAILTAARVYDNIAKWAGGGTLVPITGFSNAMVAPAMEFKSEGLVAGMAAKMFVIAGPVLVFGITASVIYGIVYALIT